MGPFPTSIGRTGILKALTLMVLIWICVLPNQSGEQLFALCMRPLQWWAGPTSVVSQITRRVAHGVISRLFHDTPQLRVIGVDGRIGELVDSAMDELCTAGYLVGTACQPRFRRLAYEVQDTGRGWFRFHHHHFHVSITGPRAGQGGQIGYGVEHECLRSDCGTLPEVHEDPRRLLSWPMNREHLRRPHAHH